MTKLVLTVLHLLAFLAIGAVAFAQPEAAEAGKVLLTPEMAGWTALAAAISIGVAAGGCGIGQGSGLSGACSGVARNPEASGKIMTTMILGFAIIESLAIYGLVISLILLYANPFV